MKNSNRSVPEPIPIRASRAELKKALEAKTSELAELALRYRAIETDLARATDPAYLTAKLEQVGLVDADWRDRALTAEKAELEVANLKAELAAARETNRKLNRRVQQFESDQARADRDNGVNELRRRSEAMSRSWLAEFERVTDGHRLMKEIYETVAPVLGLPWGRCNSVTDARVEGRGRRVFAHVYLSEKGGIESHDVAACVSEAVEKLSSAAMPEGLREKVQRAKELLDLYQDVHLRLDEGEEWGSFDCGLDLKGRNNATYNWWLGYMQGTMLNAMQEIIWSFAEFRPDAPEAKAA